MSGRLAYRLASEVLAQRSAAATHDLAWKSVSMGPVTLDYYATPGRHTALEEFSSSASKVRAAVSVVQGLLIHDTVAKVFYDVELSPDQAEAIHERDSARLLVVAQEIDPLPIDQARPPAGRIGGRCHSFSLLTVALLRSAGVPARSRCGFGAYFRAGWLEDHWITEYWSAAEERWQMADATLNPTWQEMIGFQGDPFDLAGAEFVTAGHAWQAWRNGTLDAGRCGLSSIDEHGAHWIAGNLRLDLAALNKVEMLPWDVWGAHWKPGDHPNDEQLDCFDSVAVLTVEPEANFAELRRRYDNDDLLRMDGTVFNVLRERFETL